MIREIASAMIRALVSALIIELEVAIIRELASKNIYCYDQRAS